MQIICFRWVAGKLVALVVNLSQATLHRVSIEILDAVEMYACVLYHNPFCTMRRDIHGFTQCSTCVVPYVMAVGIKIFFPHLSHDTYRRYL
jgi:hypothetical protein